MTLLGGENLVLLRVTQVADPHVFPLDLLAIDPLGKLNTLLRNRHIHSLRFPLLPRLNHKLPNIPLSLNLGFICCFSIYTLFILDFPHNEGFIPFDLEFS